AVAFPTVGGGTGAAEGVPDAGVTVAVVARGSGEPAGADGGATAGIADRRNSIDCMGAGVAAAVFGAGLDGCSLSGEPDVTPIVSMDFGASSGSGAPTSLSSSGSGAAFAGMAPVTAPLLSGEPP